MSSITDDMSETVSFIKEAMAADQKIDQLKEELQKELIRRSKALEEVVKRKQKKFVWHGTSLTIFRKGEGLYSLKGKKKDDKNLISID